MLERKVTIQNRAGIHCRPSSVILKAVAEECGGHKITVTKSDGDRCNLDSIMALLSLGLACGAEALIQVEGPREAEVLKRLVELFEYHYDFPQHK